MMLVELWFPELPQSYQNPATAPKKVFAFLAGHLQKIVSIYDPCFLQTFEKLCSFFLKNFKNVSTRVIYGWKFNHPLGIR